MSIPWFPMTASPVGEERVLVAYRSKANGERSSSEMYYLDGRELYFDEPPAGMEANSNGWYVCTGWYDAEFSSDGGVLYTPMDSQFVEHLGWTPMPTMPDPDIDGTRLAELQRSVLSVRLRAMATIQMQMAAALVGKGQDDLRKHFIDSAEVLLEARKALEVAHG